MERFKLWVRMHKGLTIAYVMTFGVLMILGVIYFSRAYFYSSHFFPNTYIGTVNVSGMTEEEATDAVAFVVGEYLLNIDTRDGERYHILGPDVDFHYVPNGEIRAHIENQKPFSWPKEISKLHSITITTATAYDKDLLAMKLQELDCMKEEQMIAPVDAHIEKTESGYELIPEVMGSTLVYESVYKAVEAAIDNGEDYLELTDDYYKNPSIFADNAELVACMEQLERYFSTVIAYDLGETTEVLDKDKIHSWLTVNEAFEISIDLPAIQEYVQYLASKYNTYADRRKFRTSSGDTIELGGGDYGWVVDKGKEYEQILADLETGGVIEREICYSQRAQVLGLNDLGNTYAEIDYTMQHMWYYEDGALVLESDVVTGNINRNNGSPDGLFKIVYKQQDAVLVGEDYSSNVKYFMPFAYNVGFHDASWRSRFGKDIYKRSGSHGCINMPRKAAEELFATIKVGTPVVAYYREPIALTSQNAYMSNAFSYKKLEENINR